jgi:hypothetical protein
MVVVTRIILSGRDAISAFWGEMVHITTLNQLVRIDLEDVNGNEIPMYISPTS